MHKKILALLAVAGFFSSCKKNSTSPGNPVNNTQKSVAATNTPRLQKSWAMDGYSYLYLHPDGQFQSKDTTYYTGKPIAIDVLNDTTIIVHSKKFICRDIDSANGVLWYSPELGRQYIGSTNFVRFYYNKDSIWYMSSENGVSITSLDNYHTK